MKAAFIQNTIAQIPLPIKVFLKRALIMVIAWKLLYHLVFFPLRIPDKQLTDVTAYSTAFLYRQFINEHTSVVFKDKMKEGGIMTTIYLNNKPSLGIADGCNGLELYILYIGFLFCLPTSLKRRLAFAIIGIISIFILNGLRCFGLTWMYTIQNSLFSFAHHYLFKIIIYAFIFYLWTLYAKKLKYVS